VPFHVAATLPAAPGKARAMRPVHLWKSDQQVPVYDRTALAVGQSLSGPAIIEERETTLVIPPGWKAAVDRVGCVVATPE
jgi:N-methylhydantoinase A